MARPDNLYFGKYRYVVDLGSGGMGDVFLALAQGPKGFTKLQVIKRLRPELAQDPEFLTMFLNEARIAARLNHPNVVQTNEVSEADDEYFIAMEYLEGQSLYMITRRAQQDKGQRFPLAMHLHVLAETCAGLHYAHDLADFDGTPLELVHRDCSPQNVFVTYEGEVKVLDFGIAKAADTATVTRTGVLKGKVPYMSPEQLEGHRVDRRADVFAVGAMLWEACVGMRLWKGLNDIQVAHRLHLGDIPAPHTFNPKVDPKLEAICMKALAPKPDDRFATAADLQAALEAYVARLGGVNRRELGRFVAQLFVDTRRDLRSKIESELRQVLPSWKHLLSTGSGEVRTSSDEVSGERIAPRRPDSVPPRTPTDAAFRRSGLTPTVTNDLVPAQASTAEISARSGPLPPELLTQRSTAMSLAPDRASRGTRAFLLAGAGAVVLAALLLVVLRGRRTDEESTPPTTSAPVTKTPAATTTASKEELVEVPTLPKVTIEVVPSTATLLVDGAAVEAPYEKHLEPGSTHEIRVEAPGYAPRIEKIVVPAGGKAYRIELTKLGEKPASKHPIVVPTAAPPAPSSSAPKTKVTLDKDDPWQ